MPVRGPNSLMEIRLFDGKQFYADPRGLAGQCLSQLVEINREAEE